MILLNNYFYLKSKEDELFKNYIKLYKRPDKDEIWIEILDYVNSINYVDINKTIFFLEKNIKKCLKKNNIILWSELILKYLLLQEKYIDNFKIDNFKILKWKLEVDMSDIISINKKVYFKNNPLAWTINNIDILEHLIKYWNDNISELINNSNENKKIDFIIWFMNKIIKNHPFLDWNKIIWSLFLNDFLKYFFNTKLNDENLININNKILENNLNDVKQIILNNLNKTTVTWN